MSTWQLEAYGPTGARAGKIEAVAVTDVSTVVDLAARTNIYPDLQAGRLVLADADGNDVYYAFTSESSGSIDDTATAAASAEACMRFPFGALVAFRPPVQTQKEVNASGGAITTTGMCRYVILKCKSGKTATLRLAVASEAPSKRIS